MARPLRKTKADGTPYKRFPAIEAAIDAALRIQDLDILRRRAEVRDRRSPDYLPSECLIHLIRDARWRDDKTAMNTLLPPLLDRCEANLKSKVPDGQIATAADLREQILGDFAELFAVDGSPHDRYQLDFFEIRFNMAFARFRITRVRAELSRLGLFVQLPEEFDDVAAKESRAGSDVLARLSRLYRASTDPEDRVFRKQLVAAIIALPPDERKAIVLCHLLGFKQEAAAEVCDVDSRTIRNRLKRAASKLSRFKEDA
jgi:RNA polymerase sigma factor (sigma-70 family)